MAVAGSICKRTLSNVAAGITEKYDGPVTKYVKCHAADACYGSCPHETGLKSVSRWRYSQRHCILKSGNVNLYCVGVE
jgi:hypothetical protein